MVKPTDNLDEIAGRIRAVLTERDTAREKVLPLCRDTIRYCGNAIRAVHRQEMEKARDMLGTARGMLDEATRATSGNVDLGRAGFFRDAQKEYTEGMVVLALVEGRQLPDYEELGVDPVSYLHGLSDAIGELRRYLLDGMRKGDLSRGEDFLTAMDDIYNTLVTIDFPDAVTGSLRRSTDSFRGVLERTRSDLTLTIRQHELEKRLGKYHIEKEDE